MERAERQALLVQVPQVGLAGLAGLKTTPVSPGQVGLVAMRAVQVALVRLGVSAHLVEIARLEAGVFTLLSLPRVEAQHQTVAGWERVVVVVQVAQAALED